MFGSRGGDLNLESGNVGARMLGTASAHGNCANELLIDPNDGSNSLLLKLIEQTRHTQLNQTACVRPPMPQNGLFMPAEDFTCVESWVERVIVEEDPNNNGGNNTILFKPANSAEAIGKAKYVLHGAPSTAEEIEALGGPATSPASENLKVLIEAWESTPQYEAKIKSFLALALQQQTGPRPRYIAQFNNIFNQAVIDPNALVDNFNEMFVRTAWDIVESNGDFRQVVTTRKWQVTTAALTALIYNEVPQQSAGRSYLQNPRPDERLRNFAHFIESDYSDWRTIEIVQSDTPYSYENSEAFVQAIRAIPDGGSIELRFPRVGFFSTPSFYEIWETNDDNQFRVTTQQTLITALDKTFVPSDPTDHLTEDGIPEEHAEKTTVCYQCHRLMDPMRLIFSNYQVSRNRAKDPDLSLTSSFVTDGVATNITTVDEFAQELINHPDFSVAWVQKLCMWANSLRCETGDPEFIRLAQLFEQNNYKFKLLVRDFFASPLFNATEQVQTYENTEYLISMSRANHFCQAINERLAALKTINGTTGNVNICDRFGNFGIISPDVFGRGNADFVQSTHVGAFDAKSIDRRCAQVSGAIFANGTNRIFDVTEGVDEALQQLVQYVVGIPENHLRYNAILTELTRVYDISRHPQACAEGENPTQNDELSCGFGNNKIQGMRAAWFAACTSPDLISVGM